MDHILIKTFKGNAPTSVFSYHLYYRQNEDFTAIVQNEDFTAIVLNRTKSEKLIMFNNSRD